MREPDSDAPTGRWQGGAAQASLRPRPECEEAHASGGESGHVSGQDLRPLLFKAGLQEAPVLAFSSRSHGSFASASARRSHPAQASRAPIPQSDQAAPLRVGSTRSDTGE